jgi:uncharacterized membrane protein YozB (DUF420 family)
MDSLYPYFLLVHSVLRYVLLLLAVYAIYRAWSGWLGNKPYEAADNKVSVFLIATVHTQLVLGLALYFFMSPYVKSGLADMKNAMKTDLLRFWTVEHFTAMFIAVILFQLGRTLSKKATADVAKHKKAAIFYTIALLLVFLMIPWPFYNGLAYFGEFARTSWLTF